MIPWLSSLDPLIWQAVIGGAFIGAGWLVTNALTRRDARRLRAEKERDFQHALIAEIRAYVEQLRRDRLPVYLEKQGTLIRKGGYFPVIPTESNRTVFDALVREIQVLPRSSIDPVVVYYSQIVAIEAMISDLRALDVGRIGPDRAAEMYGDYIYLKQTAMEWGEEAILMMETYLAGGSWTVQALEAERDAAEAAGARARLPALQSEMANMAARVSSPAADRSAR